VILGAEIGLIIFAIITMVRGKLVLTKNRVVTGVPARLLAIFGFLPLPLSLVIGFALGFFLIATGQPIDQTRARIIGAVVELGIIALCVAAVYGIGLMIARPPEPEPKWQPKRRRLEEDDEDEALADDGPARESAAASADIQPGEPRKPTHISASPPPADTRRRGDGDEPESGRVAKASTGGGRTWIIAVLAVGAVGVCCLGLAAVGGGLAWWTLRAQPVAKGPGPKAPEMPPPLPDVEKQAQPPPKVDEKPPPPPKEVEPPGPLLKLPPIPQRPTLPASQVKVKTTVPLPDRPSRVTVGGGGRYLWLYFPKLDQLGRLDVVTGKFLGNIAAQGDTELAAGLTRIVTWSPRSNTLVRYDVATGAQQPLGLKLNGKITAFCMGSASEGPLLAATESEFKLIDIETGEALALPNDQQGQPLARFSNCRFCADSTGRVFGRAGRIGSPNGVASLLLELDRGVQHYEHRGTFFNVPSPDGRYLYAGGHGVLTIDLKTVPDAAFSDLQSENARHLYLPAHTGSYYFHLHAGTDPGPGQGGTRGIRIYKLGNPQPIKIVADAETPTLAEIQAQRDLRIEDTVHLIPEAKLLVVIPKEGDRLLLHPVDL
jgi:hypothetical protein